MKVKTCLIILLVVPLFLSAQPLQFATAEPTIVRVPSDCSTIQEAINRAAIGSVILVGSGTYHENLVVNKTLTLLGEDKANTIIDGDGRGTVFFVCAENVVINGFTMQNSSRNPSIFGCGVVLSNSENSVIEGNIVTRNLFDGILLDHSNGSLIIDNVISFNGWHEEGLWLGAGVDMLVSQDNLIDSNIIISNVVDGMFLYESDYNMIQRNTIIENGDCGIRFGNSSNNTIRHNSLINNLCQITNSTHNNVSRNYWDDYHGLDDGSNGRVAGDGIGDTDLPYRVDNFPLVRPPQPIPVTWENIAHYVSLDGNSTVFGFRFSHAKKEITFNVTGSPSTAGYCNIVIPKVLLNGNPWTIRLDNTDITSRTIKTENQTYSFIYFTYNHSIHNVEIIGTQIIPEYNIYIVLTVVLILSLAVACARRRKTKQARPYVQNVTLMHTSSSNEPRHSRDQMSITGKGGALFLSAIWAGIFMRDLSFCAGPLQLS